MKKIFTILTTSNEAELRGENFYLEKTFKRKEHGKYILVTSYMNLAQWKTFFSKSSYIRPTTDISNKI